MKLIKLLYLADREALLQWGRPITTDRWVSMDHGPVVSRIYSSSAMSLTPTPIASGAVIQRNACDVTLTEPVRDDELPNAEIKLIRQIFGLYGRKNRWHLRTLPRSSRGKNPGEVPSRSRSRISSEARAGASERSGNSHRRDRKPSPRPSDVILDARRDTYLIAFDSTKNIPHLWVLVTDPDSSGEVVIVSVTTLRRGVEQTVTLTPSDHPFIRHQSTVYFARIVKQERLEDWIAGDLAQLNAKCSTDLLALVRSGILASDFTPRKVVNFCTTRWDKAPKPE
ncbi:MAG: SocA family protein [Bryobacterales bacterium]|nr:SocA family protein [Bryobacterales bacterium]